MLLGKRSNQKLDESLGFFIYYYDAEETGYNETQCAIPCQVHIYIVLLNYLS